MSEKRNINLTAATNLLYMLLVMLNFNACSF